MADQSTIQLGLAGDIFIIRITEASKGRGEPASATAELTATEARKILTTMDALVKHLEGM